MINTEVIDFKNSIPSSVVLNEDGSYTIFLNARRDFFTLRTAYLHELEHIYNDDFSKYDVEEIEAFTHSITHL